MVRYKNDFENYVKATIENEGFQKNPDDNYYISEDVNMVMEVYHCENPYTGSLIFHPLDNDGRLEIEKYKQSFLDADFTFRNSASDPSKGRAILTIHNEDYSEFGNRIIDIHTLNHRNIIMRVSADCYSASIVVFDNEEKKTIEMFDIGVMSVDFIVRKIYELIVGEISDESAKFNRLFTVAIHSLVLEVTELFREWSEIALREFRKATKRRANLEAQIKKLTEEYNVLTQSLDMNNESILNLLDGLYEETVAVTEQGNKK